MKGHILIIEVHIIIAKGHLLMIEGHFFTYGYRTFLRSLCGRICSVILA